MKKLLLALLLATSPAFAQDGPNHSVPVFGGPGFVGFRTAGPCNTSQVLIWSSGLSADPTCGSVAASVNYESFSPALDCTTDDSTALNNAIAALPNGGILYLPDRQVCSAIASTIAIRKPILIYGPGQGGFHDVGTTPSYVFKFKWTGSAAGTMFDFSPATGASNQAISGGGFVGVALDGNGILGGIGLSAKSIQSGIFRLHVESWSISGMVTGVVTPLGEARNFQHNTVWITGRMLDATAGSIIQITGDSSSNSSMNTFEFIGGQYLNGIGVDCTGADNNVFTSIHIVRGGGGTSAAGVRTKAAATANQTCSNNYFVHVSPGQSGFLVQGTADAAAASLANVVQSYDKANAPPDPTIHAGATLTWCENFLLTCTIGGDQSITSTTASTSTTTGALKVAGGVGIAQQLSIRNLLHSGDFSVVDAWTINDLGGSGLNWLFGPRAGTGNANLFGIYSTSLRFSVNGSTGLVNVPGDFAANDVAVTGTNVPTIGFNNSAANTLSAFTRGLESFRITSDASANRLVTTNASNGANPAIGTTAGALNVAPNNGHVIVTGGSQPTNSACAGFALGTGSTDTAGRVTYTSATTCTINFGTAFTNAPFCQVTPGSAASTLFITTSTSQLAVTFGTAQTAFFYHCDGA